MAASVVDLFCGAGGLTHGFTLERLHVVAGVDSDPACQYPYEHNNPSSKFLLRDVGALTGADVRNLFAPGSVKVLAGCAPCQPFSTYTQGRIPSDDGRWGLLGSFTRILWEVYPEIVAIENVPRLQREEVYREFIGALVELGYRIEQKVVRSCDYGVPQARRRLVVLASLLGPIGLVSRSHAPDSYVTVRDAIKRDDLEPLAAGDASSEDPLHAAARLSPTNLRRMKESKPSGTWRDWDEGLLTPCHRKDSGKTYSGVYGRMAWDSLGPTITTECYSFGSGRFGHPQQDRAITLREAALLQTFPRWYAFVRPGDPVYFKKVGRLIGNAVPVELARAIGRSIKRHLEEQERTAPPESALVAARTAQPGREQMVSQTRVAADVLSAPGSLD